MESDQSCRSRKQGIALSPHAVELLVAGSRLSLSAVSCEQHGMPARSRPCRRSLMEETALRAFDLLPGWKPWEAVRPHASLLRRASSVEPGKSTCETRRGIICWPPTVHVSAIRHAHVALEQAILRCFHWPQCYRADCETIMETMLPDHEPSGLSAYGRNAAKAIESRDEAMVAPCRLAPGLAYSPMNTQSSLVSERDRAVRFLSKY